MTWIVRMKNLFVRLLVLSPHVIWTLPGINEPAGIGMMEEEIFAILWTRSVRLMKPLSVIGQKSPFFILMTDLNHY